MKDQKVTDMKTLKLKLLVLHLMSSQRHVAVADMVIQKLDVW